MPKKRPGFHNLHIEIKEDHWRLLQHYCLGGTERITASAIVNNLLSYFVDECIKPRLEGDESTTANYNAVSVDMQRTIKEVAHKIEPGYFEKPEEIK
jgi:hypothetical protein